jgi:hypothetical protein
MSFCRQILQTWYTSHRYWKRLYVTVGVSILDKFSAASSSLQCPMSVMNGMGLTTISAVFCLWVTKFICSWFCCVMSQWLYYNWDWSNVNTQSYSTFLLTSFLVLVALWELLATFVNVEYHLQESSTEDKERKICKIKYFVWLCNVITFWYVWITYPGEPICKQWLHQAVAVSRTCFSNTLFHWHLKSLGLHWHIHIIQ